MKILNVSNSIVKGMTDMKACHDAVTVDLFNTLSFLLDIKRSMPPIPTNGVTSPVHFLASIRTDGNYVVTDCDTGEFYYECELPDFIFWGSTQFQDSILYSCKNALEKYSQYSDPQKVIPYTHPMFPGAFEHGGEYYVYCVLVLHEGLISSNDDFILKGNLTPIESLSEDSPISKILKDSLVLVKSKEE